MFIAGRLCEVCHAELQFRTIEADFDGEVKVLKVCDDCAEGILRMEELERRHRMRHRRLMDILLSYKRGELSADDLRMYTTIDPDKVDLLLEELRS